MLFFLLIYFKKINFIHVEQKKFSIGEAFESAWQHFKQNAGFFLLVFFVTYALSFGWSTISTGLLVNGSIFLGVSILILSTILQVIMSIGLLKISLRAIRGEKNDFFDLFSQYRFFWKYVFSSILFGLCAGAFLFFTLILFFLWTSFGTAFGVTETVFQIGTVFLGLLGLAGLLVFLFFATRFQFFGYCIVDKNAGIRESLRVSYQMTQGIFWKLFILGIILILLNVAGAMVFFVGLFFTVPITMLITALVYERISKMT